MLALENEVLDRCVVEIDVSADMEYIYLALLQMEIVEANLSAKSGSGLAVEVGDCARYWIQCRGFWGCLDK